MKITYYDLLGLIEDKESPKEVYLLLHTNQQEKVKYYWDEYSECYVINDETQEDDNYNFYLRDSLLDGQSFEALIEIIEEEKKIELPEKINELVYQNDEYGYRINSIIANQNQIIDYLKYKEEEKERCLIKN